MSTSHEAAAKIKMSGKLHCVGESSHDPSTWLPLISIVTGTRHRPDSLRRFVESVAKAQTVDTEIVVSDASDAPGTYSGQILADYITLFEGTHRRAKYDLIFESPRLGTAAGYNQAFKRATGRYVAWFNDDCELVPGWDAVATEYMRLHPWVGIGAIYFKDRCGDNWQPHYSVQTFHGMQYANFGVLRKEFGNQIGWFGDCCTHYGVDNAICFASLEQGAPVVPIPGCKCIHWREHDQERIQNNQANQSADPGGRLLRRFATDMGYPDFAHLRAVQEQYEALKQPNWIE